MSWYRWSNVTRNEPSASTSAAMRPRLTGDLRLPRSRRRALRHPAARQQGAARGIAHLLKRPVGRLPACAVSCQLQLSGGTWDKPRRVAAKVDGIELYPRSRFIVTNLGRPAERVVAFYNQRGTRTASGGHARRHNAGSLARARLQPRQLVTLRWRSWDSGTDQPAREAHQDRSGVRHGRARSWPRLLSSPNRIAGCGA